MFDVSIVIVNFNSKLILDDCLASIQNGITKHAYEVIVVDNASTDGSDAMVISKYPEVILKVNKSNYGFIMANNMGMRHAKGRYVLCLNNDTVVMDRAIDNMVEFMEKDPDIGAIGPKLLNSDGTIQLQCRRGFPTPLNSFFYFSGISKLFPKNSYISSYMMTYLDNSSPTEVDSLCGAAIMVRREVIDKAGLMDESYFMYGDDIDWCYRIKHSGWKVIFQPTAEIVHFGGKGGSRHRPFRNIVEFHRSMAIYHKKHNAETLFFVLNWPIYAAIWAKCAVALAQNLFRKEKIVGTRKP
jgi:GT2 family glycosyltransferase